MPRNRSRITLRPIGSHRSLRLSLPPAHYHLRLTHDFLAEIEDGGWLARCKGSGALIEINPVRNGYAQAALPQDKAEAALAAFGR